ncbi:hypothetical protein NDU88_004297 [Pleurodeles waltl]|uniref:Uncharacterized protein n=1 Tax=Pleurodeles waltl TaxID=8319 RepID=A0AAV7PF84_PLEWA|nr:hypothetical protein NDU88_004297 [Pleurodeles waltl]
MLEPDVPSLGNTKMAQMISLTVWLMNTLRSARMKHRWWMILGLPPRALECWNLKSSAGKHISGDNDLPCSGADECTIESRNEADDLPHSRADEHAMYRRNEAQVVDDTRTASQGPGMLEPEVLRWKTHKW